MPIRVRRIPAAERWQLCWRGAEAALRPARTLDGRSLAPMIVLGAAAAVATRFHMHLGVLMCCWVMSHNLRRGYVARPGYSLLAWCSNLRIYLDDAKTARAIAASVRQHMHEHPDPVFGPRSELQAWAIEGPWRICRRRALAPLDECAERALEVGDLEYCYYVRFLKAAFSALGGEPVTSAERALREIADGVRRAGHLYPDPVLFGRPYRLLLAPDPGALSLESEIAASEAEMASQAGSAESYVRRAWILVLCIYGQWELALHQAEALRARLPTRVPFVHAADDVFFRGLMCAQLATSTSGLRRRRHRRELRNARLRLVRWARSGHDLGPMASLLRAEQMRLRRDLRGACDHDQDAARSAGEQDYLHLVALAHERHGRALSEARRGVEARRALAEAADHYRRWGCDAKSLALEQEQRTLLA